MSAPQSTPPSDPSPPQQPPSEESSTMMPATTAAHYASLHTYPFQSDVEFRAGLSQILQRPITDAELLSSARQSQQDAGLAGGASNVNETILRAKCFYFSRCVHTALRLPVSSDEGKLTIAA